MEDINMLQDIDYYSQVAFKDKAKKGTKPDNIKNGGK